MMHGYLGNHPFIGQFPNLELMAKLSVMPTSAGEHIPIFRPSVQKQSSSSCIDVLNHRLLNRELLGIYLPFGSQRSGDCDVVAEVGNAKSSGKPFSPGSQR